MPDDLCRISSTTLQAQQKTAGTPAFFSPETCDAALVGRFDPAVVDLWAIGVTLYLWLCGKPPFLAPTQLLLLEAIRGAPPVLEPPESSAGSAGLHAVLRGLCTRDIGARLTLPQLRKHPWLSRGGEEPLPSQPGACTAPVHVSATDIAGAVTPLLQVAWRKGTSGTFGYYTCVKWPDYIEYTH